MPSFCLWMPGTVAAILQQSEASLRIANIWRMAEQTDEMNFDS